MDGLDCLGLCLYLMRKDGMDVPAFDGLWEADVRDEDTLEFVRRGINARKVDKAEEGCLLDMRVMGKHHMGYCVGDGKFVHASEPQGKVVIDRLSRWQGMIMGVYSVKD